MAFHARSQPSSPLATIQDLLAIPEEKRFHEILYGHLIRKASPSFPHGSAVQKLSAWLDDFAQKPGGRSPGGWRFSADAEVQLAPHQICRPDLAGWRREHMPNPPKESPILILPDWVCEILSPSNARNDLIRKKHIYHEFKVPHYWIIDPMLETLTISRWMEEGYLEVVSAEKGDRVHPEPFEVKELRVSSLFGDDEEE